MKEKRQNEREGTELKRRNRMRKKNNERDSTEWNIESIMRKNKQKMKLKAQLMTENKKE